MVRRYEIGMRRDSKNFQEISVLDKIVESEVSVR